MSDERVPKRRATGQDTTEDDEDANALFAAFEARMVGEMRTLHKSLVDHIATKVGQVQAKCDEHDVKLREHDVTLSVHRAQMENMAAEHATLAAKAELADQRLGRLEAIAALPETTPTQRIEAEKQATQNQPKDPFLVDHTILRINSNGFVAKAAIQEFANSLCARAGISPDQFEVRGGPLARRFTLAFHGEKALASRRARKTNEMLRRDDGTWEAASIATPEGGEERLYICLDKANATIAKEKDAKTLRQVLANRFQVETEFIKSDCSLAVQWRPLCKVVYLAGAGKTAIEWTQEVANKAGINTTTVENAWAEEVAKRKSRG